MADIQDRLRAAQTRRSQATATRARDEVEVENAKKALDAAKAELQSEFGVVTGADLKKVQETLAEELEAAVAEIELQLDAAGA